MSYCSRAEARQLLLRVHAGFVDHRGGRRRRLLTLLETANDSRRQTYFRLLAVVNGWPPPDDLTPPLTWFIAALHAHASDQR